MCPVASGHWRNAEGWGTFFSGLFSLWSQDLKETHRTTYFKAIGEDQAPREGGVRDITHFVPKPNAILVTFLLEYTPPTPPIFTACLRGQLVFL